MYILATQCVKVVTTKFMVLDVLLCMNTGHFKNNISGVHALGVKCFSIFKKKMLAAIAFISLI